MRLGVSTSNEAELERALAVDPDYVAFGPVYSDDLEGPGRRAAWARGSHRVEAPRRASAALRHRRHQSRTGEPLPRGRRRHRLGHFRHHAEPRSRGRARQWVAATRRRDGARADRADRRRLGFRRWRRRAGGPEDLRRPRRLRGERHHRGDCAEHARRRAPSMPPPDVVRAQIAAVLDDFDVAAIKIGMLANAGVAEAVAASLPSSAARAGEGARVRRFLNPRARRLVRRSARRRRPDRGGPRSISCRLSTASLPTCRKPPPCSDSSPAQTEADMAAQGRALVALGPARGSR